MGTEWRDKILASSKYQIPKDMPGGAIADRQLEDVAVAMDWLDANPQHKVGIKEDADHAVSAVRGAINAAHPDWHSGGSMGVVLENVRLAQEAGWESFLQGLKQDYDPAQRRR